MRLQVPHQGHQTLSAATDPRQLRTLVQWFQTVCGRTLHVCPRDVMRYVLTPGRTIPIPSDSVSFPS